MRYKNKLANKIFSTNKIVMAKNNIIVLCNREIRLQGALVHIHIFWTKYAEDNAIYLVCVFFQKCSHLSTSDLRGFVDRIAINAGGDSGKGDCAQI